MDGWTLLKWRRNMHGTHSIYTCLKNFPSNNDRTTNPEHSSFTHVLRWTQLRILLVITLPSFETCLWLKWVMELNRLYYGREDVTSDWRPLLIVMYKIVHCMTWSRGMSRMSQMLLLRYWQRHSPILYFLILFESWSFNSTQLCLYLPDFQF